VRYGRIVENGFLSCFSVETEEEASKLLVLACQKDYNNNYIAKELTQKQTLENLLKFSNRLEELYESYISKKDNTK